MNEKKSERKGGALFVALGIFLSRIAGLIRQRAFAHYFGNSDAADAFNAAYKIPNFLQNLFGEGVLSASFIPVYANLMASKYPEERIEAKEVASTIFILLSLITSILVLFGVLLTPFLIDLIAPGFHGEKKILTIKLVQILFPGTGLLVLCAWCLGVLNSHRHFFLSYAAPVIWNLTIIGVLLLTGNHYPQFQLAEILAYGLVLGSFLQFAVQFPVALKCIPQFKLVLKTKSSSLKIILKNFFPVIFSRGVVQLSAYIDSMLASLLPTGAVSALAYAQLLYLLPVSLFGMSISAAELPAMSALSGDNEEIYAKLRPRLDDGLLRIAFFIIPSVCAFLFLGDAIISLLFQSGKFNHEASIKVWWVLCGSTVGLLATTFGRLYSSTFYSLKDTRTPLKFAIIRVLLTTVLGAFSAFILPPLFHIDLFYGTVGLTASAGVSGWVEFILLRRALNQRIGETGPKKSYITKLWLAGTLAGIFAYFLNTYLPLHYALNALISISCFGAIYFACTYLMNISFSRKTVDRFLKIRHHEKN